jgi:phosphoribosylamine--glycine ligase
VLIVGSGGREHALAWKIAQSPQLSELFIAPGNPGTAQIGRNIPVDPMSPGLVVDVAWRERIDLVVIGPEAPLAAGLTDACLAAGLRVFGPTAAAARIESSKSFAKRLMLDAGVPTAHAHTFSSAADAANFVRQSKQAWVVKADGLAAGKGVIVPDDIAATLAAIEQVGASAAGHSIVLEERLYGEEISLLALCDGRELLVLPPARDHKRLLDGDQGPNTGGMGAVAPIALDEQDLAMIVEGAMRPVVRALAAAGTPFHGALYAGLMLTEHGPRVLEFNARFGDPETQVILPLVEGDLLAALAACAQPGHAMLAPDMLGRRPGAAACIVMAAAGYPEAPRRGDAIQGVETLQFDDVIVFQAGTEWSDGRIVTGGGRVLGVTGLGHDLRAAVDVAYAAVEYIQFEGAQFRRDIGALDAARRKTMINVINAASGEQIGTISEDQLQFLIDNLEEEWADDQDYYISAPTVDMLEARGADAAMVAMLRGAAGEQGVDVRWTRAV